MKQEFSLLLKKLYAGSINNEDFLTEYSNGKKLSENHILQLLEKAIASRDNALVEEAIVLIFTGHFRPNDFLMYLCQLLSENWHMKHEDIAVLLKQMKSPKAVDFLYYAAEIKFEYLEYDDTYQFARKCIKALSAIGNGNVVNKLRLLAGSKKPEIAGFAEKELRNMGVL